MKMGLRLPHNCPHCGSPIEAIFMRDVSRTDAQTSVALRDPISGLTTEFTPVRGFEDLPKVSAGAKDFTEGA